MPAVFIPQSMLDAWADQGKVELADNTLHLLQEQRSVNLNPAVRFLSIIGDDADPHGLKGKVKTTDQLKEMGAEHYMDSVILGDVGYQVVEGFMGDLTKPAAEAAEQSPGHERAVTMPPMAAIPPMAADAPAPSAAAPSAAAPSAAAPSAAAPSAAVPSAAAPSAAAPGAAAPEGGAAGDRAAPLPIDLPSSPPAPTDARSAEGIEGAVAEAIDDSGDEQPESDAEALSRLFLETVQ